MKVNHKTISKLIPYILASFVGVPILGMASNEVAKLTGFKSIPVEVVGTGSMYPSLFWATTEGGPEDESKTVVEEYRTTPHLYRYYHGLIVLGKTFFKRQLGYGDMVAFKNTKTRQILQDDNKDQNNGFIKRIIALPGDTVELRDGFVYLNSTLLSEPYITAPRSTYGGTTLKDCEQYQVPPGSIFVLGDNRKVSSDSRFELGVISEADVEFVLPYAQQVVYHSLWRDTSKDDQLMGLPTMSSDEFISLVNEQRKSHKLTPLKESKSLVKSSESRGDKLLLDQNTKYSLQQAIASAGYSNIVLGEFVSHGRFTAKELLDNILYQPGTSKQILSKEYTDLGVSAVTKVVSGCPTQIIVGHLGGYIPASYDASTIKSWGDLIANLSQVIPGWEQAQGYSNVDKSKLAQLLTLLRKRQSLATEILDVMQKRQWLTPSQEARIKQDEIDAALAESLARELNN
ncbi:MAG: signal peptidase I [Microgenomates group bacterium]